MIACSRDSLRSPTGPSTGATVAQSTLAPRRMGSSSPRSLRPMDVAFAGVLIMMSLRLVTSARSWRIHSVNRTSYFDVPDPDDQTETVLSIGPNAGKVARSYRTRLA
jgi:hypothetical protein